MWEHDLADWRWGIDVNVLGVVHGIRAFCPILLAQDEGHIINTCSGNGGFAPIGRGATGGPANAVYPMTKAAVLCLTESLYSHLQMAGSRVRASVLFPAGFLNTGIWESWRHRPDHYAPTQERQNAPADAGGGGGAVRIGRGPRRVHPARDGRRSGAWKDCRRPVLDDRRPSKSDDIVAPRPNRSRSRPARLPGGRARPAGREGVKENEGGSVSPMPFGTDPARPRRTSTTRSTPPRRRSPPRRSPSPTSPTPRSSPRCCPGR